MPAQYEMAAFIAYRNGYKEARESAERKAAAAAERSHPGGALIAMFPGGRINIR